MKITELYESGKRTISFEFFPPNTEQGVENLFRNIGTLRGKDPDFISVTYGAGGGTRDKTIGIVRRVKEQTDLEVMCHVTCVAQTKEEVESALDLLGPGPGGGQVRTPRGGLPVRFGAYRAHPEQSQLRRGRRLLP